MALVEVNLDPDVIRHAVGDAISAVLGNIHGLEHGRTVQEATDDAVRTIMTDAVWIIQ